MKEIKFGQKWKTSCDEVVTVITVDKGTDLPFRTSDDVWRNYSGVSCINNVDVLVELLFDPDEKVAPVTTKHCATTLAILELRDKIKDIDGWLSSIDHQIEQKQQERIQLVKQLNEIGLDVFDPLPKKEA